MSERRATTLALGLIGPGLVGKALLAQVHEQGAVLKGKLNIDLQVYGIAKSDSMLLSQKNNPIDLSTWQDSLLSNGTDVSIGLLTAHLNQNASPGAHKVIIDATASDALPRYYKPWLEQGIHIVTPNKKLNSGPFAEYLELKKLVAGGSSAHYLCEGTVGAGLPIISTLRTLLDTGDQIDRIEGVFSGTLSYIFNQLTPGARFSDIVSGAKAKGYTEPDPREDLSGADVGRKVLTLARECGATLEMSAVAIESLVPKELTVENGVVNPQDYIVQLPNFDTVMAERIQEAAETDEVLRYVGSWDAESGVCRAGLRKYAKSHPFANLSGTENIISFTTARYSNPPLIVRGPGAGPAVTAAGVFGDLITLARYLGAPCCPVPTA